MIISKKQLTLIILGLLFILSVFNSAEVENEIKNNEQLEQSEQIKYTETENYDLLREENSDLNNPEISENKSENTTNIPADENYSKVNVLDVVDGDTVKVSVGGGVETIRVIGINTPETVHPSKPVECFGIEASRQAKKLLSGQKITIVSDESQGERDKYGRLLAYITMPDGRDFGKVMIEEGFAYEYTYGVPYEKQTLYKNAQAQAAKNQVGLWEAEVCTEEMSVAKSVVNSVSSTDANCTIKGNISSKDEKIYHVQGQQYYEKTIINESSGERWFCSEDEALSAGWRKALQ